MTPDPKKKEPISFFNSTGLICLLMAVTAGLNIFYEHPNDKKPSAPLNYVNKDLHVGYVEEAYKALMAYDGSSGPLADQGTAIVQTIFEKGYDQFDQTDYTNTEETLGFTAQKAIWTDVIKRTLVKPAKGSDESKAVFRFLLPIGVKAPEVMGKVKRVRIYELESRIRYWGCEVGVREDGSK